MCLECRTSETYGWCANGVFVAVSQRVVASIALVWTIDTPRKRVCYTNISLVCDEARIDFPVSVIDN